MIFVQILGGCLATRKLLITAVKREHLYGISEHDAIMPGPILQSYLSGKNLVGVGRSEN
jgi:hypothetical protein